MSNRYSKLTREKKEVGYLPHKLLREFTATYVFLMLAIYPLYYQDKYYNMGDAKWQFFKVITFSAGVILAACFIWYMAVLTQNELLKDYVHKIKMSVTDWFVLAYMIAVLISVLLSPYKSQIIWGYDGWYMGLIAQTCFVLIYYFVSRYWRWDRSAVIIYLGIAFVVFLLAILMRFRIDPLEMYVGLDEQYIINFLTTIGQATWYSSYMCIIFPLGMFVFWYYDNTKVRVLSGIFTAVGFMTMITQNSDSAFISFAALFFLLFWISMTTNKHFERFLEVLIVCLASFKFMGICQIIFKKQAVELDSLPTFFSQGNLTWILLLALIVLYIMFRFVEKKTSFAIEKYKFLRAIALGIIIGTILAVVIYIYMNSTGKLPANLKSDNNYLLFDEFWGNNRGSSWTFAVKSFLAGDFARKLFGAGPDGFSSFVYSFFGAELNAKWGEGTVLTCAHNEWLNSLINLGIVGATCYIGIFVATIKRCLKNSIEYPELYAVALAVIAYMGHNFFCYQQIICTPTIFIIMGMGEALIRNGRVRD